MKNAVVVGATGGIGSKLVVALKNNQYNVLGVSRNSDIKCDLTDYKDISKATQEIKSRLSSIDLLIIAAGIGIYKNIVDTTDQDIQQTFMVNTIAPATFIRELAPFMSDKKSLVLSLGSGAGVIPMRGRSIYCSSKYALRGLHLSLNEEYKDKSPNFCLITLGSTLTNFGPMTVEEKQKEFENGRAYFPVDFVVEKLIEIINDPNRANEITLYPGDHGFGQWKKP
jgi:short-subunit dehydrogenase